MEGVGDRNVIPKGKQTKGHINTRHNSREQLGGREGGRGLKGCNAEKKRLEFTEIFVGSRQTERETDRTNKQADTQNKQKAKKKKSKPIHFCLHMSPPSAQIEKIFFCEASLGPLAFWKCVQ